MCAWAAWDIRNEPRRCTPITVSQSTSVILNSRLSLVTPALLTRIVGGPSVSAIRATASFTAAALLTSAPTASACPPSLVIRVTVSAQLDSSRSTTATAWPSLASRSAVAAPMPRAAPVTIATLLSVPTEPPVVVPVSSGHLDPSQTGLLIRVALLCSVGGLGGGRRGGAFDQL